MLLRKIAEAFSGPGMAVAGINHFRAPEMYLPIMPDYLPAHRELVYASGVTELVGGVLSMVPATRKWGGYVNIMTLLGVSPVHVHMIVHKDRYKKIPPAALWVRLPLQVVMLYLVYVATLADEA